MKRRNQLALGALVLLSVGYATYDVLSEQRHEKSKQEGAMLYSGPVDQIKELQFVSNTQNFAVERTDAGWKFVKPLTEDADSEMILEFLEGITTEKSIEVIRPEGSIDWKIYGLDQPLATITLGDNLNQKQVFRVSLKKNFQGDVYLRKNEEASVYVVAATWQQKAARPIDDFRDRRWARLNIADIESVKINKGKESFTLIKKDSGWASEQFPQWKLDQNKVRKFISSFSTSRYQNFQLAAQAPPLATVTLQLKKGKRWVGSFGINQNKKQFLKVENPVLTGEILPDDANEVYRISLDVLRDRTEPFQFRRDDVSKLQLTTPLKKSSIEMGEATGKVLAKFASLELADFTDKKDDPRVNQNFSELLLSDIKGQEVLRLRWGGLSTKTVSGLPRSIYWAKSSLYPWVFSLDEEKIKELGLIQLFVEKTNDKPEDNK